MYRVYEQRLSQIINAREESRLLGGGIGLEKECLRVGPDGGIARSPHPTVFGSALTNPYITTDYSEALLEFITPPRHGVKEALHFLFDVHKFVYDRLDNEILWATSMPCVLAGDQSIPIAQYGRSNAGTMKTVYRRGLGYRYGHVMQVIAGVHFNYSLPDAFWPMFQELLGDRSSLQEFINGAYFGMIRNLQRFGWLIPYLFGASPAVCKSFLNGRPSVLSEFDSRTYYEPFATSLRMGDIGYQNHKEDETGIKACYDSLEAYVASLACAIDTPSPAYEQIGVVVNGEYRQLNANILQIENEYYSTVRPKQVLNDNEKPSLALKRRGVRYVELRSLDVNAFDPLGINETQMRFVEAFMLFCLLHESPTIDAGERVEIDQNQSATAHRGREPGLVLQRYGHGQTLRQWADEICSAMEGVCGLLDSGLAEKPYGASLALQKESVKDPDRTPSARMLAEMRQTGEGFFQFAKRMSQEHQNHFAASPAAEDRTRFFEQAARESLQRQAEIEAADSITFDEYLQRYFAQR